MFIPSDTAMISASVLDLELSFWTLELEIKHPFPSVTHMPEVDFICSRLANAASTETITRGGSSVRRPVRPQSAKKDFELDKSLKEMLLYKIIGKSNAVYYSHPVIVQRTANTFQFCVVFRNLNGCTKPAS